MTDNRKDALMKRIQMYAFVAHECALYLDCHPNNAQALERHAKAIKEMNEAVALYEGLYGPLTANAAGNKDWSWVKGAWPWQNKED
ncbi:MAG: spore coat protein CotJB [Clostridia bacterium]|nr:spore coat protein CotJB [Clostridia bacterium]